MTPGQIYQTFAEKFPSPSDGALRVWWIPQIPGKPFRWPVMDLKQAALLLDALAAYDDFQLAQHIKPDYSNVGGLEVFRDGDWEDWESEDYDDFRTYREMLPAPEG